MIVDVSSLNSRTHALRPVTRLVGEDALLGLGQQVRPVAARRREVVAAERRAPGRRGAARRCSSGSSAHSSSTKSSSLLIAVPRSSVRAMSAPVAGSVVSTAKRRPAYEPGPADQLADRGQLVHERRRAPRRRARRCDRGTTPSASARRLGVVEERVDARVAPPVDQRLEVPGDVGGGAVCVGGDVGVMRPVYAAATA